jgi:hypothetical protein
LTGRFSSAHHYFFILNKQIFFSCCYQNGKLQIRQDLEEKERVTAIELDKYKLLVDESDVITNLLLKLCHKLANTENLINFMQLKCKSEKQQQQQQPNRTPDTATSIEEIVIIVMIMMIKLVLLLP